MNVNRHKDAPYKRKSHNSNNNKQSHQQNMNNNNYCYTAWQHSKTSKGHAVSKAMHNTTNNQVESSSLSSFENFTNNASQSAIMDNEKSPTINNSDTTQPPTTTTITDEVTTLSFQAKTVFISGLHPRVANETHLRKLLSKFGTISRLFIKSLPSYCFCEYHVHESAQIAIASLNGRLLLGRHLVVKPATCRKQGKPTKNYTRQEQILNDKILKVRKQIQESNY